MTSRKPFVPLIPIETTLLSGFKDITVVECKNCKRVLRNKRWVRVEKVDELTRLINQTITLTPGAHLKKLDVVESEDHKSASVYVSGKINGTTQHQEYTIPVHTNTQICKHCAKERKDYQEGALQLRHVTDDVLNFVTLRISQLADRGVFANKVIPQKDGFDLEMSSQKAIRTIGKEIVTKFGGQLQVDAKLHTADSLTSKDVYRIHATYTGFLFGVGDIITEDSIDFYQVVSIAKGCILSRLPDKYQLKLTATQAKKFRVAPQQTTRVTRIAPTPFVLDEQFQEIPLESQYEFDVELKPNQELLVTFVNGVAYYTKHI
jgi:NMD protein affecting ribosome stability and mRNA decay